LIAAIETDIGGEQRTRERWMLIRKDPSRHTRRVGTAILFESSAADGQGRHGPELLFALGEPTWIRHPSMSPPLRWRPLYFIRKVGSDGFRIGYQPTMKKVVSDRRASLDEETI